MGPLPTLHPPFQEKPRYPPPLFFPSPKIAFYLSISCPWFRTCGPSKHKNPQNFEFNNSSTLLTGNTRTVCWPNAAAIFYFILNPICLVKFQEETPPHPHRRRRGDPPSPTPPPVSLALSKAGHTGFHCQFPHFHIHRSEKKKWSALPFFSACPNATYPLFG